MVGQSTVLSTINSMRAKFHKPPLIIAPEN
nr:MetaGeneMark_Unknown Function [uncultured bacterium]